MTETLYQRAERFVGIVFERPGADDHPLIRWWHSLCTIGEQPDEVPWCSSFLNGMAWDMRLPRSKSAAARSWLGVGVSIPLSEAEAVADVIVLRRGTSPESGHCGLYSGRDGSRVHLLGGNQANAVSVAPFEIDRVLGVRRLIGV